jgi:hypothetical protein
MSFLFVIPEENLFLALVVVLALASEIGPDFSPDIHGT